MSSPSSGGDLPGDLVAVPRLASRLLDLAREARVIPPEAYQSLIEECGCRDPGVVFRDLTHAGFFLPSTEGLALSIRAHKTLLFVSGALGRSSESVFDELRQFDSSLNRFELVRQGMTSRFIKGLVTEPGFQRIYICSPWINLIQSDIGRLTSAVHAANERLSRPPEIYVLVKTPTAPPMRRGINALASLGAHIVEKPNLHSKLYMREPGPSGGLSLAIVGSENLTRQKWIELGIQIRNDSHILSRLRRYFFDVFGRPSGE